MINLNWGNLRGNNQNFMVVERVVKMYRKDPLRL